MILREPVNFPPDKEQTQGGREAAKEGGAARVWQQANEQELAGGVYYDGLQSQSDGEEIVKSKKDYLV